MTKSTDGPWEPWEHDANVRFQQGDGMLRIEVRTESGRQLSGWMLLMGGMVDATIRQHLHEMGLRK